MFKRLIAIKLIIMCLTSNFNIYLISKLYPTSTYTSYNRLSWKLEMGTAFAVGRGFEALIYRFEGLRLKTYNDHGLPVKRDILGYFERPKRGFLTIGYGHLLTDEEIKTGKIDISTNVRLAKVDYRNGITKEQAYLLLRKDTENLVNIMERVIKVRMTQNRFDATASYGFNVGYAAFYSKLKGKIDLKLYTRFVKALNKEEWYTAASHIDIVTSAGVLLPGLITRRQWEQELFLAPDR